MSSKQPKYGKNSVGLESKRKNNKSLFKGNTNPADKSDEERLYYYQARTTEQEMYKYAINVDRGMRLFQIKCLQCHNVRKGDSSKHGPVLYGILGRKAGSVPDFGGYSNALKSSEIVWTRETLHNYLADPAYAIPGTRMWELMQLQSYEQRDSVITFLENLVTERFKHPSINDMYIDSQHNW
mmetsp:Transcript_32122/g.39462  ORF Transcript_32122/g.39462 Transcript_32122/m.39462 type:complete len:182 (-) Transcript_32122:217-762(-)